MPRSEKVNEVRDVTNSKILTILIYILFIDGNLYNKRFTTLLADKVDLHHSANHITFFTHNMYILNNGV